MQKIQITTSEKTNGDNTIADLSYRNDQKGYMQAYNKIYNSIGEFTDSINKGFKSKLT